MLRHAADHARTHGRRLTVSTGADTGLRRVLQLTGTADGVAVVEDLSQVLDHVPEVPPVER